MTTPPSTIRGLATCPYLGTRGDPETHFVQPHRNHRCRAVEPATTIHLDEQLRWCFADYATCPRFIPLEEGGRRAAPARLETGEDGGVLGAGQHAGGDEPSGGGAETLAPVADRLATLVRRFSFEEWTIYTVVGILLVVLAYNFLLKPGGPGGLLPTPEPTIAAMAVALEATSTTTPTPHPSVTPRPTRQADSALPATVPVPTAVEGGMMAALSPSERGVGSFNGQDRLGDFGQRELNVGEFNGVMYVGGVLFPLDRLPSGSKINYVALELAGLSEANLGAESTWNVDMLDPAAADGWSNLTFETLLGATAKQVGKPWVLTTADLAARKVNVLEFSDDARDTLIQRLDQGKVAFRITGPKGSSDNLFAWDTGYGEGFGTRPVLRVGFVPPPPTAGPAPGEPTEVPLVVWIGEPTPAPTTTPLPDALPDLLAGKILFLTDRFGQTRLMVYDPAEKKVGQVTKQWPYDVAMARQRAAAGVSVSVAERPCGSGATAVVGVDNNVLEPADPGRRCAQILVSSPDTPNPIEVTDNGFVHYDPVVSPDGQWIAYTSQITGSDEIFKVRRDGSANTRLTDNEWQWDKHPAWSPDGTRIVFWSNREGRKQLYVMDADGSNVENISQNAFNDWDPVWVR